MLQQCLYVFCFESEQIKNVLQVPSQMVAVAVVAPQCGLYFILVLSRVVHYKINLQDLLVIPLTLLLLCTAYRKIFKKHQGWPKLACIKNINLKLANLKRHFYTYYFNYRKQEGLVNKITLEHLYFDTNQHPNLACTKMAIILKFCYKVNSFLCLEFLS